MVEADFSGGGGGEPHKIAPTRQTTTAGHWLEPQLGFSSPAHSIGVTL